MAATLINGNGRLTGRRARPLHPRTLPSCHGNPLNILFPPKKNPANYQFLTPSIFLEIHKLTAEKKGCIEIVQVTALKRDRHVNDR